MLGLLVALNWAVAPLSAAPSGGRTQIAACCAVACCCGDACACHAEEGPDRPAPERAPAPRHADELRGATLQLPVANAVAFPAALDRFPPTPPLLPPEDATSVLRARVCVWLT